MITKSQNGTVPVSVNIQIVDMVSHFKSLGCWMENDIKLDQRIKMKENCIDNTEFYEVQTVFCWEKKRLKSSIEVVEMLYMVAHTVVRRIVNVVKSWDDE